MGAVALRVRSDLRNRWAAWLALALLVSVFVGGVAAIAAGARRTDSAYSRFVGDSHPPDLLAFNSPNPSFASLTPAMLARLPRVHRVGAVEGYDVVHPAAVGLVAPTDSAIGYGFWFRKLLSGRMPDPTSPDEVTVSFITAEQFHLHVGDHLSIVVQTRSSGTPETVTVHIVGVDAAVTEFPPRSGTGGDTVWATPAFNALHPELASDIGSALQLDHGAADLPAVKAEIAGLGRGKPVQSFGVDDQSANTQRAIHLQAVALWILAGLLGLAALLITAQLLARQSTLEARGYRELRALGMTTRQIWTVGMVRTALLAVVASVVGVVGAAAVSAVFPIGLAAIAEPHLGFTIDVATLGLGLALSVAHHRGGRGVAELAGGQGIVVGHPSDRGGRRTVPRRRAGPTSRAHPSRWSPGSGSPSNGAAAGRPRPCAPRSPPA